MTKTFYIFLDIDGVLNFNERSRSQWRYDRKKYHALINTKNMKYFDRLVKYIDDNNSQNNSRKIYIIISSTWRRRLEYTIKTLQIGTDVNLKNIIIGRTDLKNEWVRWSRANQIARFVKKYKPSDYIILDDDTYDIRPVSKLLHINRNHGYNALYHKKLIDVLNKFIGGN